MSSAFAGLKFVLLMSNEAPQFLIWFEEAT
jgi:hypothetical protein